MNDKLCYYTDKNNIRCKKESCIYKCPHSGYVSKGHLCEYHQTIINRLPITCIYQGIDQDIYQDIDRNDTKNIVCKNVCTFDEKLCYEHKSMQRNILRYMDLLRTFITKKISDYLNNYRINYDIDNVLAIYDCLIENKVFLYDDYQFSATAMKKFDSFEKSKRVALGIIDKYRTELYPHIFVDNFVDMIMRDTYDTDNIDDIDDIIEDYFSNTEIVI